MCKRGERSATHYPTVVSVIVDHHRAFQRSSKPPPGPASTRWPCSHMYLEGEVEGEVEVEVEVEVAVEVARHGGGLIGLVSGAAGTEQHAALQGGGGRVCYQHHRCE